MEIDLTLVWAIIVSITLGVIVLFLIRRQKKHDQDIQFKEDQIIDLANRLSARQTRAWQAGVNISSGDYSQILGEFALLSKYDHIITLSTTSQQPSLDLLGITEDSLDFLEIKKKGVSLSDNEKHIKKLVEEKKVAYKIFDIDLPDNFSIEERTQQERTEKKLPRKKLTREERSEKLELQKIEARKKDASAYEPWTEADDEFLEKYWKDESNKRNRDELIQELSEKLLRSTGGIKARLKSVGLIE